MRPDRAFGGMALAVLLAIPAAAQSPRRDSARVASPDTSRARARASMDSLAARLRDRLAGSTLKIELNTRLEAKAQQTRNERCATSVLFRAGFSCRAPFTPALDAQFSLKSSGGFNDRSRLDVDYDSQREFDGSNAISLSYQGKGKDILQKVEVGNVFFTPPASRFITAGIPSGNFGMQVATRFGPVGVTAIAAQQKGNVVRDQVFTVGGGTLRTEQREIEDYQVEPRRFFFTIDPTQLGAAYPNIDIIDAQGMQRLAESLPDTVRPSRVFVYRLILGGQPPNPNGPRFQLIGDPLSRGGQVYELLREGVDYYLDPSLLWFALVRPLSLNNERLVVAYSFNVAGRDTVIARLGGTPDLEYVPGREQLAHLVWDPQVSPSSPTFRREIRSVYRIGGDDIRRETVQLRIVAGTSAEQEKPRGGTAPTYLQLFGLAQVLNPSAFDAENRLWPRPNDPNFLVASLPGSRIFRDQFVVFPSLEPFARRGLARPPEVAANDTIYRTPNEYLYSSQHPQSFYRLVARYDVSGGSAGTIALNSVQVRPGSERLTMDGRLLMKGVDYDIDYELGRVTLLRPDTLARVSRRVVVRYEENPLFATVPTSIVGMSSLWTFGNGQLAFTAISQSQRTTFTRPPLGFEPQAGLVAGLAGNAGWELPRLAEWLSRGTAGPGKRIVPARLDVTAEVAVSQPRQRHSQQAYIESFESEGSVTVNLLEAQWQVSSQPALGRLLGARYGTTTFDTTRATTLAWQNAGTGREGRLVQFTIQDIDPQASLAGTGVAPAEQLLWLTMYPLSVGGRYDAARGRYRWLTESRLGGRRWRSIRTTFGQGGSGIDLSRGEQLEFWTLIDTAVVRRGRNPTLVFDFGDPSENSVAIGPDSVVVVGLDSTYHGRHLEGWDRLDSERDPFSRAFNADVNDLGLPGDVVARLPVSRPPAPQVATNLATCAVGQGRTRMLGDNAGNCTARNGRLDEEDLDLDGAMNFTSREREQERVRRYVVDLADRRFYTRIGKCGISLRDANDAIDPQSRLCWVQVRLPFGAPDDSTAGGPTLRRTRALRLTVLSGSQLGDAAFSLTPITRLRIVGAPWLKRADRPIDGAAGSRAALAGTVVASTIGTQDRDSTRGIFYESPPGVTDAPDQASSVFGSQQVQVNERSLRLLATQVAVGGRAEAYFRFPEGQRSLMGYRELRLWARGRGRGWGPSGDLQVFVKLGRDADNFYLYRTTASSGTTRAAWEPEVRVKFDKFYALRARLQNAFLEGDSLSSHGCNGIDSVLVARSQLPLGLRAARYAACEDGYMVYTVDPAVTPPNLAAVQELAVGIVRVDSLRGGDPLLPGDTAEVWVDDVRLADMVTNAGYAGEVSATLSAGDAGSLRVAVRRRDPNFRQLGEAPSFLTNDDLELSGTWRLDKVLPPGLGLAIPLTVAHRASQVDPEFLTRSDIRGAGVEGLRTPRARATTFGLSVRRTAAEGPWYLAALNHVVLDGHASLMGNRTEFQDATVKDLRVGMDLSSAGFFDTPVSGEEGRGFSVHPFGPGAPAFRLSPTSVRLTSAIVTADDRRASYLKPAGARDDPRTVAEAAQRLWRSTSSMEWALLPAVKARWDASSAYDLRGYQGGTLNAQAARAERGNLLGVDIGLERERTMTSSVTIAPGTQGWVRPRVALGSTYSMLRDPGNRSLVVTTDADDVPDPFLTRRTGSTQYLTLAATIDPALAFTRWRGEGSWLARAGRSVRPFDVTLSRNQIASYDGIPVAPGLGFQFGLGGIDAFRSLGGYLASNAGASTDLVVANALALGGGMALTSRLQHTASRHWNRRGTSRLTRIEGEQDVLPDLGLRWSGQPQALRGMFSSLGLTARALKARQLWTTPTDLRGVSPEVRRSEQVSLPVSGNVVTAWGQVALSASYAWSQRVDSLPGSLAKGSTSDLVTDIAKSVPLPRAWGISAPLRARASYQQTLAETFVSNAAAAGARSRLTDNGRRALNLNLDTELSETMTFSLQGSRLVTFDRNFNRRIVQTIFSAVFQMQFFAGASQ